MGFYCFERWGACSLAEPHSQQPAEECECWAAQGTLAPPRTLSLFPLAGSWPGASSRNLYLDLIMNWGVWNQHTVEILSQHFLFLFFFFFFDVGFNNMSTWPYSLWQMCIPWSKITWVPQQYFRMLLPSLYEPCPSSQRGWPMKPWDSARALQVCGEHPDKFILGELNISVLHRDGVLADFRTKYSSFCRVNNVWCMKMSDLVINISVFPQPENDLVSWCAVLVCSWTS